MTRFLCLGLAVFAFSCARKPSADPTAAYIDPLACKPCHAQIYGDYQQTAMARSFYRPTAGKMIEDYTRNNAIYHAPSGFHYEMLQRDGRFFQRRFEKDPAGSPTHVFEREVHFIIGSGNHARTYLHLSESGELIELPVSWYPQENRWAMSPGFDSPNHADFRRRVDYGCLFCHNAYPELPEGADRYGRQAVFPPDLPQGIDCQRCHGPGENHAKHLGPIVNPARLAPERQLEICLQCHLETTSQPLPASTRRFGRGVYSFRPGEALSDYTVYFDHPPESPYRDKFEIAGAAYQLMQSACFLRSEGRMTCTTCHNPHLKRHYLPSCLDCHPKPHTAGDCVSCHMPKRRTEDAVHVVMTDHRIPRNGRNQLAPRAESHRSYHGPVSLYYPRELPVPERDLYLGIALAAEGADRKAGIDLLRRQAPAQPKALVILADALLAEGRAAEAVAFYRQAFGLDGMLEKARVNYLRALPDEEALQEGLRLVRDRPAFADGHYALGLLLARRGDRARAAEALRQATRLRDDFAEAYATLGELESSVEHLRAAVVIDPRLAQPRLNLGRLLYQSGRRAEAVNEFRAVVRRHPDFAEARLSLGVALGESGDLKGAAREFREVLRLEPGHPEAARNLRLALE